MIRMDVFVILLRNSMGYRRRCLQEKMLTRNADRAKLTSLKCLSPGMLRRECSQAVEMQCGCTNLGKLLCLLGVFICADLSSDHSYELSNS